MLKATVRQAYLTFLPTICMLLKQSLNEADVRPVSDRKRAADPFYELSECFEMLPLCLNQYRNCNHKLV